ncbi:hypothetical protein HYPSUDRAFT_188740 [Hypholoma sublateritium FD-334 SS-4]|uniref:SMODS and SLOG-associating 2TM effector domain-containing protein n=1 Tax=Hypholoma sublateritium (strain FD-334 SS-4) TaxID=945553 RepID=A0A0D2PKD3_HYPSF|nr:hypothetical protein HYPSUDRAFT_188740 [Hypholoma sublateritium FD-334 SS-4]
MAPDHPGQHASATTPVATNQAPGLGERDPDLTRTSGLLQESVGSYTTTRVGGNLYYPRNVPSQASESSVQQSEARVVLTSPSDLERGMDPMPSSSTPVDVVLSVIPHGYPTPINLPLAPMPAIYGGAGARHDARPVVDRSPQRQRQDPFAGSQDGSPPRQSYPNLPNAGSHSGSPVERFGSAGSHQQYRQDSGNTISDRRSSRFRQPSSEERISSVGRVSASAQQGNGRGPTPHQGFGARLRHAAHAAEDYLHVSFPNHIHEAARHPEADPHMSTTHSLIDHIVPVKHVFEKEGAPSYMAGSVGARLSDTLADAKREKDKYAAKAKWLGLFLNIAIGLQVLLGSLTTGLSAVATQGKSAAVETTILGALATLVASYLAQARGSNEPQLSLTRVKDLKQFIRECNNFIKDHGEDITSKYNPEIDNYRKRFENLLGNTNGERKQLPSGSDSQKSNSS